MGDRPITVCLSIVPYIMIQLINSSQSTSRLALRFGKKGQANV
jgi:hypothetical protein